VDLSLLYGHRRSLSRGIVAAVFGAAVMLVTPLAATLTAAQAPSVATTSSGAASNAFYPDQAERMVRYIFDTINERYLEPVSVASLAVEGLRGLGSLDGGLAVVQNGSTLVMTSADRVIATLPAPAEGSVDGWSKIVVELISIARAQSPALLQADNEAIYEAVFDAMLAHLDHFSRYAGAYEARQHRESRSGFGGVGVRYNIENTHLNIEEVLPETPAEQAGLKPGDKITAIDGVSVSAINEQGASIRDRLRGPINSPLALSLIRGEEALTVQLRRGLVVPQTVRLEDISDGIARIKLSSFNQRTTSSLVDAFEQAQSQSERSLRGVILDMRGNPGGLLDQAVDVADLFMHRGRIVFTKGRHPEAAQSYSARPGDIADHLPMVVLVDGRSASAAEIVAAALQDSGRAVVVGSTSYGKGTVQTVVRLPNDGEMTLTWSRFHSPSGYALHGLGVLPSVCITTESEAPSEAIAISLNGTASLSGAVGVGISGPSAPDSDLAASRQPISVHMAEWRSTPLWDNKARAHLRAFCPPLNQDKWAADIGAAYELLNDRALYSQALSLSGPQSAQR
jgi:carboxyl-terminal processing protease